MSIYPQDIIAKQKINPWSYYVLRPIALKITPVLAKSAWASANGITWVGFAVGLLGCVAIGVGWYWAVVVGAALINIRLLLDNIDGTMARIRKTVGLYGEWLDGFTDYILDILVPVAIGIGLFMGLEGCLGLSPIWYLVIGLSYTATKALRLTLSSYHKSVFGETIATRFKPGISGTTILLVEVPLLLVCAVFHILDAYLVFYGVTNLAAIGVIAWKTLRV